MLCPPTHGTRRAVYRRLYHILINFSCTESLGSGITSAGVAALAESNFAQIDGFDDAVELCSGGGVVAFHRLLMFAHDTYSGTNGHLTPFVRVDSKAISLNLRSTTVATQVRSRDVTAFAN